MDRAPSMSADEITGWITICVVIVGFIVVLVGQRFERARRVLSGISWLFVGLLRGILWVCVGLAALAALVVVVFLFAIMPAPHVSAGTGVIIVLLVLILMRLDDLEKRK